MRRVRAFAQLMLAAPTILASQSPDPTSASLIDSARLRAGGARSVAEALAGKVSGARVVTSSGRPGQDPWLVLRNAGMNPETDPVFVVDGVVARLGISDLSVDDIESVEVLKGAATAAEYGIGAGNGVLLITTRRATHAESMQLRSEFGTRFGLPPHFRFRFPIGS